MRIGVVMDASCDLPQEWIERHHVTVLPIVIKIDDQVFSDQRDGAETQRFLDEKLGNRSHSAHTEPYPAEAIQALFLERLVVDYDCVFCLTVTANRSPINANATRASFGILKDYRPSRQAAGHMGPFLMRVIDTQSLFAGAGPAVVAAAHMAQSDLTPAQIRERLEHICHNSYGYMLPRDLYYLRARGKTKGDRSVGLVSAALGSALDIKPLLRGWRGDTGPVAKMRGFDVGVEALFKHVAARVRTGLLVPVVCLSYGGDLAEMRQLPGYQVLMDTCAEEKVQLLESTMSITGMVNVGQGALTVGFASEEYTATF